MKPAASLAAFLLGFALAVGTAGARAPDLSSCPPPGDSFGSEVDRTRPIAVPAAFRAMVRSDRHHFAIATLDGRTFCVDTGGTQDIGDMALFGEGRFLGYRWYGYEVYGYILVDRSGAGASHEIGARPVFAPGGRRFAVIDQTESEFGMLSGLEIWQAGPAPMGRIGRIPDIPRLDNWRIDSWLSNRCIRISAIAQGRTPEDPARWGQAPRETWVARASPRAWKLQRGSAGCQAR